METMVVPLNLQTTCVELPAQGDHLCRLASLCLLRGTAGQRGEHSVDSLSESTSKCGPPSPTLIARPGHQPRSPVEVVGQSHGQHGGADAPEQAGRVAGQHLQVLLELVEESGGWGGSASDPRITGGITARTALLGSIGLRPLGPSAQQREHTASGSCHPQQPAGLSGQLRDKLEPHGKLGPLLGHRGDFVGAH